MDLLEWKPTRWAPPQWADRLECRQRDQELGWVEDVMYRRRCLLWNASALLYRNDYKMRTTWQRWNASCSSLEERKRQACMFWLVELNCFVMCSVLKEVVMLVNESTIRCNEYLNGLMKIGEIVRTQTKNVGYVWNEELQWCGFSYDF